MNRLSLFDRLLTLLGAKAAKPRLLCAVCEAKKAEVHGLCADCAHNLPAAVLTRSQQGTLDGLCAVLAYRGHVRTIIHRYKFRARRDLALFLAQRMAALDPYPRDCVLIPVPLHKHRRRQRGFSQTLLMAEHLAELTGRTLMPHGLVRTRNTPPQASLSGRDRLNNLHDAFAATDVAGLKVILIDDIVSTGTTLQRCADALRAAGAAKVYAITAAAAAPPKTDQT